MKEIDFEYPHPSTPITEVADNVVATSQPLAAQAGLEMLQKGGNAVDATLAAAITLTVVEPCSNGVGSIRARWSGLTVSFTCSRHRVGRQRTLREASAPVNESCRTEVGIQTPSQAQAR